MRDGRDDLPRRPSRVANYCISVAGVLLLCALKAALQDDAWGWAALLAGVSACLLVCGLLTRSVRGHRLPEGHGHGSSR